MLVADTIVFIPHQLYSRFCDIGRSLASVTCLFVCALKGKWLELSTSNLAVI